MEKQRFLLIEINATGGRALAKRRNSASFKVLRAVQVISVHHPLMK